VAAMLKAKVPPEQVIEELYVRCLSRAPDAEGTDRAGAAARRPERQAEGSGRRLLGAADHSGIHVQPLKRLTTKNTKFTK